MEFAAMKRSEVIEWANNIVNENPYLYHDDLIHYKSLVGNDKDFRDVMERERKAVEGIFLDTMAPLILLDQELILENRDAEGNIAEMKKRKYSYALPYAYSNTLTPAPILCELEIIGQERRLDDINTPKSMKKEEKGTIRIKSEWNCITDDKGKSDISNKVKTLLSLNGYCTVSDGNRSRFIECQSILY